jgi:hypothetical protein
MKDADVSSGRVKSPRGEALGRVGDWKTQGKVKIMSKIKKRRSGEYAQSLTISQGKEGVEDGNE